MSEAVGASSQRLRRTMMFVPGNNPGMVKDAGIYGADSLMFDLEDSVALDQKDAARLLILEALGTVDFGSSELVCRVNDPQTEVGRTDIFAMVKAGIDVIRLPKTADVSDVENAESIIAEAEQVFGREVGSTRMMAAIESAEGVLNAPAIARSTVRLIGIALGAEDYVTDMRTHRYPDGQELFFARSMILHAARAAGIAAFDTVFSDVENEAGFRAEVELIHQLGFDGKSCINPRQVPIVNEVYTPTAKEIANAREVLGAIEEAHRKGSGVIALKGRMVDKPVVARAQRVMKLAQAAGLEL